MKSKIWYVAGGMVLLLLGALATQIHGDLAPGELETRYTDGASRFIKLDIHPRVHYRDEGPRDAPVIILLHGTAASLHTFDELTRRLIRRYRVLRFDLTGFGLTGPCDACEYTPREDAEVLRQFMSALGVKRAVIAGNSLGGRIAWEFGLRHPSAAQALVLLNPLGYPWPEKPMGIAMARVPVLGKIQRWLTPRSLIRKSLLEAYYNDEMVTDELVERYFVLLRRKGNRAAFVTRVNVELDVDSARIPELKVPVQVLWGKGDIWLPLAQAKLWQKDLPKDAVRIYPGVGHMPQEEIPDKVAAQIFKLLER